MPRNPRREEIVHQLRLHLPRILVLFGIGLFVVGIIATIAFVAGDSSCNAATNPNILNGGQVTGAPASGSFCGHAHGFLTISYLILIVGAILIGIGAMILPTLRARDARMAREKAAIAAALTASPAPAAAEKTGADEAGADEAGADEVPTADAATTTPPGSSGTDSEVQSEPGSPQSESANPP
jgi:uncharacterized membrane protein